jgi:hypothetical protein
MTKRCLVCDREIVADNLGVHDATIWTSHGNYGSTVYDPLNEETFLEACVCDDCLVRKKALIEEVKVRRPQALVERRPPNF